MLRFVDTIRPMLLAPLGSVVIHAVGLAAFEGITLSGALFIVLAIIYGMSLAAGLLFVVPVFALVPGLRQPRLWVAIPYGAFVGIASAALLGGAEALRWQVVLGFASAGSAAGLVYALAAKRSGRRHPPKFGA